MRRRQVKKFAKRARIDREPYRAAMRGTGSKKLNRRRRAFGRYFQGGLARWDWQQRVLSCMKRVHSLDDIQTLLAEWERSHVDLTQKVRRMGLAYAAASLKSLPPEEASAQLIEASSGSRPAITPEFRRAACDLHALPPRPPLPGWWPA